MVINMTTKTPINDYIKEYCESDFSRFHMPGHKGQKLHGLEAFDITEINGADYLYEADGVIAKSEKLTSQIFGSKKTLYSTEGSSLSIKTMLNIVSQNRKDFSQNPLILAPRNVHKAFINGCCLLDIDVEWIYSNDISQGLCSCIVTADEVDIAIRECERIPDAVYITSPDYLGNIADVKGISQVCHEKNIPLIVDNAHGAYLKFLDKSLHPIDLGADMCCDSAHKTLPVYTGGSYLHISKSAPNSWAECSKEAMALFASTSPSYLIMESLDKCCGELQSDLPQRIRDCAKNILSIQKNIKSLGWDIRQNEPLKLTIYSQSMGYSGNELAQILREKKIECEYADKSCVVLMCSPYNKENDFKRLISTFSQISRKGKLEVNHGEQFEISRAITKMPIRQAFFSKSKKISVEYAEGKICGKPALSCQPSIPIIFPGELITGDIIEILKSYGIFEISVI